jgi:colanic acid/amylovoran biosynthesis protein
MENIIVKHIVLETALGKGVEEYGNMGDVSMLQIAVDRLHKLFPHACIEVLTDSAENLARFCPTAKALDNRGRVLWFSNEVPLGRLKRRTPKWILQRLREARKAIRSRYPRLLSAFLVKRLRGRNRSRDAEAMTAFLSSMDQADLFILCGAGGFYDGCQTWSMEILDVLEAAIQRKKPTFMLGQGFGPLSDPIVAQRAAKIFPLVDLITLRGGRGSFSLLRSLGVPESKVQTTGDEALELAYEARSERTGRGLGIGFRFGASATVNDDELELLRSVLQAFARRHAIPLVPLPIAIQVYTRDDLAIKRVLMGFDEESDGGKTLDSPLKVIKQAAQCRVVVTGAYHAAVFALAQGIPVVALAKSPYFAGKMLGLEDQFGDGCRTILLSEAGWPERLQDAIEKAWQGADELRKPLQAVALRQIELTRRSYQRLLDMTTTPRE